MSKEILDRKDVKVEYKWTLEDMFKNVDEWNSLYEQVEKKSDEFLSHKGKLGISASEFLDALKKRDEISRSVEHLYSYAHMNLDVDTRDGNSQEISDKALSLIVKTEEKMSFLVPEILAIDEEKLKSFFEENEELKLYKHDMSDILRQKEHILSEKEEAILAQLGELESSPEKTFSMMNNADLKFPSIEDEEGKMVEITHGNFIPFMESKNREVRKNAYTALYKTYEGFKNTFASTLNGEVKKNIFNANVRKYSSSREAALDVNNVPVSVYDNLIEAVHSNLDSMHKYMKIRKRALGLDELHMYDLYTPIVKDVDYNIEFEDGVKIIKKALKPLGKEYMEVVEEGFSSGWIDIYENRGKRSGAYSSGSYDSKPYILLNYHNTLDNMFTTAHEMGHSIHSYFTRKTQPYVYGGYSIFVAEVASTANESLLLSHLIANETDKTKKLYLLNHYLESFRTTVFRQTMFAEFEKIIHEYAENGGALTADYLCKTYKELNELYYGEDMIVDDEIAIEWARIPHFYYNYYVFQYATGYSAAVALSKGVLEEGEPAVEKYLNFLKSGSSNYPIEVLKLAGVDMTTKKPVDDGMKLFKELVDEMDKLI